ncbi:hypothetical protein RRG08_006442 [Elysia crispata]|uniref:EGF-like domain-containing protein n=1 Tax=Elysia crispata TaxID=231223 RepID=A0AAE1D7V2_9GAST|nr:hypothetical protein RRG08_006442 [Elysia crispata]
MQIQHIYSNFGSIIYFFAFANKCVTGMSCPQEWDFLHLASKKCVLPFSHYSTLEEARKANLAAIETAVKMLDDDEHDFIIGKLIITHPDRPWTRLEFYHAQELFKWLDHKQKAPESPWFPHEYRSSELEPCIIFRWHPYDNSDMFLCINPSRFKCEILRAFGSNTYDMKCSRRCSPYCVGTDKTCDHKNGSCVHGCVDGYQGELCDRVCGNKTYGPACSNNCSPYCGGEKKICNHINGSCVHGCVDGYQGEICDRGEMCDRECENNTYGVNCSKHCSPFCGGADNSCDNINGSCVNGCIDGYYGELCDAVGYTETVKNSSEDHMKTIAAIFLLFLIAGLVISSVAFSPEGFLTEEDKTGTGPESEEEESRSVESNQLWMLEEFTVQYDSDIAIDQEESNYLSSS